MSVVPTGARLCRETVRASRDFQAAEPWTLFDNYDVFLVSVPGETHPLVVSITGSTGEDPGLRVLRGETALENFRNLIGGILEDEDTIDSAHHLVFTIEPLGRIPPEQRRFITKAGVQARRDALVPSFIVNNPGRQGREINQTEALIVLYLIRGILVAMENGLFERGAIYEVTDLLHLTVSGDPLRPDVLTERVPIPPGDWSLPPHPAADETPDDLFCIEGRWLVSLPVLPVRLKDDDRTIRAVIVADLETGLLLGSEILPTSDLTEAGDVVRRIFSRLGVPAAEIVFSSRRLLDSLAQELGFQGVDCSFDPHPPLLDEIMGSFETSLAARAAAKLGLDSDAIPAPDDLPGWEAADRVVLDRLTDRLDDGDLMTHRSRVRYFGSDDVAFRYIEEAEAPGALDAYVEWLVADYRPTKKSRTLAERLLEDPALPAVERILLEARVRSRASLWRVLRTHRGESVELLDIISGAEVEAHGDLFSRFAYPDHVLPGRILEAGDYRFIVPLGPMLDPFEVDPALEFLAGLGLPPSADAMTMSSHLLGRLWAWTEESVEEQEPLRLTNTDGEDLEFQTATFAIADRQALRAALDARVDVEASDEEGEYSWSAPGPDPKLLGGEKILGHLRLQGSELRLEVNSTRRLLLARSWLDAIPGVTFLRREMHDRIHDTPDAFAQESIAPPEPVPPPTPEAAAALREMFQANHMRWLDERLPMFRGKTPREMCATEEGRLRVAATIRAMPDPGGPLGEEIVGVPREAMLRELGIE